MMCQFMETFLYIVTTLLLFRTIQALPSLPKPFIEPSNIELAERPIVNDYLYVDKTQHILNLFQTGKRFFFVRPRRFGKSTFLRTLEKVFNGTSSKVVFEGTDIHKSSYSWDRYPVLYLDFGNSKELDCENVTIIKQTRFQNQTAKILQDFKKEHHLSRPTFSEIVDEFQSILKEIKSSGTLTVVLIDEYDLPVLVNMKHCLAAQLINKDRVEAIFQLLKTEAGLIKFAFVTGVSKAVFRSFISPPDLVDITNDPEFHDIAGLTESDLNSSYIEYIDRVSKRQDKNNVIRILKDWYDGYQFAGGIDPANSHLYSPLSVHHYFRSGGVAQPYYDDKAHAEFLFDQMIQRPDDFSNLNLNAPVRSDLKGGKNLDNTRPAVLLYDAGYLTIKSIENGQYYLGFPNKEMELAFHKDCADSAWFAKHGTRPEIRLIGDSLKKKEPEVHTFMKAVNSALMKLKIRPKYEQWYQHETRNFMDQAEILCTDVETPIETKKFGKRKIDITGYDEYTCFLFEVKRDESLWVAWEQANKSIETFLNNDTLCPKTKNLLAAGITFSSDVKEDNILIAYQAKLFEPNGKVLDKYQSKQFAPDGSVLREYLTRKSTKTTYVFSSDNLFEKSR